MKVLLKSAIRDDNPVMVVKHNAPMLGPIKGRVPDNIYTISLGNSDAKREGRGVIVGAIGLPVYWSLATVSKLQAQVFSIEIFDPEPCCIWITDHY